MKVGIPKERRQGEARVAGSPDMVRKLVAMGVEVIVETGAGDGADIPAAGFEGAGAAIAGDAAAALADADIVLKVRRPLIAEIDGGDLDELAMIKRGAALIGLLDPYAATPANQAIARAGVNAFAMELLPRISRADRKSVV